MDVATVFAWIREPIAVGNLVKGVERCLAQIEGAHNNVLRLRLIRELGEICKQAQKQVTVGEWSRIQYSLARYPQVTAAVTTYAGASHEVNPVTPRATPGKANALFVVRSAEPFGCLHTLTAIALRSGKGNGMIPVHATADPLVPNALYKAHLALGYFLQETGLTLKGWGAYLTYDIPVEIGVRTNHYEGDSLGLAGAMAAFSALIGEAVPVTYAFTGSVSHNGEIQRVGSIKEKIEAAADKGMQRVFLPVCNLPDVPDDYGELVVGVSTLQEVIVQIFVPEQVQAYVQELNGLQVDAALRAEAFAHRARGGVKVLISCVGQRDPYGAPYGEARQIFEGAILTSFRRVMPRAVCLLATPQMQQSGQATQEVLEAIVPLPQCQVTLASLDVDDPTVYDDLIYEMGGKIRRFLHEIQHTLGREQGIEPYLLLSSGTPQMQAVWVYLLNTEETLRGARVLQVREPQYVRTGEERVREVVSGFLQIGVS